LSDAAFCLVGWLVAFAFILSFLFVWKLTFPRGEPGIIERAKAARDLYREATTKGEVVWSVCLGVLLVIKGTKGLIIGFFTFLLGCISASICGYDPLVLLARILDFLERLLFRTEVNPAPVTDTTSG
jgi:hypothetical protein